MSVISLTAVVHAKKQSKLLRLLDAKASYVALEVCLSTLNMNDLKELDKARKEIKHAMAKLAQIEKDAEKESN